MDKKTVAQILAFVEKNCTEVEEVEEYLWELLDENDDISAENEYQLMIDELKKENKLLKEKLKKEQADKYNLGQGM